MPGAREYPDVAFEIRQELNVDMLLVAGDKITERVHRVLGGVLGAVVAQRIGSARRDDAVIGGDIAATSANAPTGGRALNAEHALLFNLRARGFGPAQE